MITGIVVGVLALAGGIAGLWHTKRARRAKQALDVAGKVAQGVGPSLEKRGKR